MPRLNKVSIRPEKRVLWHAIPRARRRDVPFIPGLQGVAAGGMEIERDAMGRRPSVCHGSPPPLRP